jgi:Dullard-like phosphatase family protein
MKIESPGIIKIAEQPEKYRSDSEVRIASSDEDVKLSEVIIQTDPSPQPPPATSWISRLCSCFSPANRNRTSSSKSKLLSPQLPQFLGKATLVLDLDETLAHASFAPRTAGDLVFQLDIEEESVVVSVLFRPGAQAFLLAAARLYEVVIFTASMSVYANKVIDVLDAKRVVSGRLFRDSCTYIGGAFIKDLNQLGRDLRKVVIIDVLFMQNSPVSYLLHPRNALPISSWYGDSEDKALFEALEDLEALAMERDLPAAIPGLVSQRKCEAEISNSSLPPVVQRVPEGIPNGRGNYNSPTNSSRVARLWPDAVANPH